MEKTKLSFIFHLFCCLKNKRFFYFISRILYSKFQAFAFTFTISHFFFQIKDFQTGDSFEIFGSGDKISDSVLPTIL
jgi:hypothetical protein